MNKAHRSYLKVVLIVLVLAIFVCGVGVIVGVMSNCGASCASSSTITVDGEYKEVTEKDFNAFVAKVAEAKYGSKLDRRKGFSYDSTQSYVFTTGDTSKVTEIREIKDNLIHSDVTYTDKINGVTTNEYVEIWHDGEYKYTQTTSSDGVVTNVKTTELMERIVIEESIQKFVNRYKSLGEIKYYLVETENKAKIECSSADGKLVVRASYAYDSDLDLSAARVNLVQKGIVAGDRTYTLSVGASLIENRNIEIEMPN